MKSTGRYALVVGEAAGTALVEEALAGALPVTICRGPDGTDCPAVRGEPCSLRDEAAVSVVYVTRDEGFPTLPCATISDSPTLAVLEGVDLPAAATGDFALVGSGRGAAGVVSALAKLIDE